MYLSFLEAKHGKWLVTRALSLITASKDGIADIEMDDLLSAGVCEIVSRDHSMLRYN